jgi:hypothetical protein
MSEGQGDRGTWWRGLSTDPGCCVACRHAKLNETRRGTAYLRCLRAEWDPRLRRYPTLPVLQCAGFEPAVTTENGPTTDR